MVRFYRNTVLAICLIILCSTILFEQNKKEVWIDRFDKANSKTLANGDWYTFSDKTNGGESTIVTDYKKDASGNQFLEFSYLLQKGKCQWTPYATMACNVSGKQIPSGIQAIAYEFKGSEHSFIFNSDNIKDYAYYQKLIPASQEWRTVIIYIEAVNQPYWGQKNSFNLEELSALSWQVNGQSGDSGKVAIDNVRLLYTPIERVTKTIDNITITFPIDGYANENRDEYIKQSLDAIKSNCQLIELSEFKTNIKVKFYRSKQEMIIETPYGKSGISDSYNKTVYMVANENFRSPPIKHELLHLIATLSWGEPVMSSQWMNEGLATYAQNNCNGYTVDQIYRYLLESGKLISMDSLSSDFYIQPEMFAYHQSAYIVEYLVSKYGMEKFKTLWQNGFEKFKEVYGITYSQFEADMQSALRKKIPTVAAIDWDTFMLDCK